MDIRFLVPAILFLSCLAIRSVYELLKEARKITPENKLVFAIVFTSMCVLWVSWFSLCPADPVRVDIPGLVRWIGLAIFIIGTLLSVGALVQLRGVENIDHLVTTGLFRRFRHPMYIGFIAWILGWGIFHGAAISLSLGVIGIVSILWWRHLEEARLVAQFGHKYEEYRVTTWF